MLLNVLNVEQFGATVVIILLWFGGTICVLVTRRSTWALKIRWALLSVVPALITISYLSFLNVEQDDSPVGAGGLVMLLGLAAVAMNWIIFGFFRKRQRALAQGDVARSA